MEDSYKSMQVRTLHTYHHNFRFFACIHYRMGYWMVKPSCLQLQKGTTDRRTRNDGKSKQQISLITDVLAHAYPPM